MGRYMSSKMYNNFRIALRSRPGVVGEPQASNFAYEVCEPLSPSDLKPGEALLKTLYLSIEPGYLRYHINEKIGLPFITPIHLNDTIIGLGGVGQVLASKHPDFKEGDFVTSTFHSNSKYPWKAYLIQDMSLMKKIDNELLKSNLSLNVSLIGTSGLTALLGIWTQANIKRDAGQTMVMTAAAGCTGSIAGQAAMLEGCTKVVGICGTDEKCTWLKTELGFHDAINYKTEDVQRRLKEICPEGVDIFYDNVGGPISEAVIKQMVPGSHIILCGEMSTYNTDKQLPTSLPDDLKAIIEEKNITRDFFLLFDFADRFDEASQQLVAWYMSGQLKVHETVSEGLENAGKAFVSVMMGGNIGRQVIHVADPE